MAKKTPKQRALVYKTVNKLRNRDIIKHTRTIKKALDDSLEPFFVRLEATNIYNEGMLSLIDEQPLQRAIKNIYNTTASTFAISTEKALTKQSNKFDNFSFAMAVDALFKDTTEGGLGMLITQMTTNTKKLIAADIQAGIANGSSIGQMANILRDKYTKNVNRMRGLRISRTETIKASNWGSLQGAIASEVNFVKEWNAIGDSRTRGSHITADGQQQLINDPFKVNGYKLMYPVDSSLGAPASEIVNCRCVADYIDAEDADFNT